MKRSIVRILLSVLVTSAIVLLVGSSPAEALSVDAGYIEVDDGRIFYEATGSGPAIIMIHDGILHRETWNSQFRAFAGKYRVMRWDRRGFGQSDRPNAPFSNLDDLLILMDTLEVERATLMGCSSGGLLAIDFALNHPERVSSLVLVGPIISGFGFSKHFNTRGGRMTPKSDASVAEKIEYWARNDPWITAPESEAAKDKIEMLLNANPHNLIGSGRYARGPGRPAMNLLSEIRVPALIISGESDIPDVQAHIGVIQAGIAGSKRVVIPYSGHLTHFEVPHVFNQVVLDFLEASR